MTYGRWRTRDLEPCTEEARAAGCTCGWTTVHATDIDPPEPKLDRWCPIHGRDPDEAYEEYRERRDEPPDTDDDYRDDSLDHGDVGSGR